MLISGSASDYANYGADVVDAALDMEQGDVRVVDDAVMSFILYRDELPEYSSLTTAEKDSIGSIGDDLSEKKINEVVKPLTGDIEVNKEVTGGFDIRTAHKNSYY